MEGLCPGGETYFLECDSDCQFLDSDDDGQFLESDDDEVYVGSQDPNCNAYNFAEVQETFLLRLYEFKDHFGQEAVGVSLVVVFITHPHSTTTSLAPTWSK